MATQMQLEVYLARNRMATRVLQSRDNKTVDKDKTEKGYCFCTRVVKSIKLRLIVTPQNLEYRERDRQRK